MTKIEIKNRWTSAVIYSCDVPDEVPSEMALRHALEKAAASGSDLRDCDLRSSDLRGSDLSGSFLRDCDLRDCDLRGSNLSGSCLRGSDLRDCDLSGSDLRGSDLRDCDLSGSNLRGSDLSDKKNDFWNILLHAPAEVQGLRLALAEGRIDGSTYEGQCACLVGTIANVRHANYKDIGIKPDSTRPAERWFTGIKKGDTPETNQISRIAVEWLDDFVALLDVARAAP